MYAVIETGGKQYRVEVGTELEIELLEEGAGESVAFDRVLLVADGGAASIGRPVLTNASVSAEVLRRDRGDKVISFKYRPKARRRVKKGHRQELTVVRISDIVLDGKSAVTEHGRGRREAQDRARATPGSGSPPGRARMPRWPRSSPPMRAVANAATAAKADTKAATKAGKDAKTPKAAAKGTTKASAKADTTDAGAKKASARAKTPKSDKD